MPDNDNTVQALRGYTVYREGWLCRESHNRMYHIQELWLAEGAEEVVLEQMNSRRDPKNLKGLYFRIQTYCCHESINCLFEGVKPLRKVLLT